MTNKARELAIAASRMANRVEFLRCADKASAEDVTECTNWLWSEVELVNNLSREVLQEADLNSQGYQSGQAVEVHKFGELHIHLVPGMEVHAVGDLVEIREPQAIAVSLEHHPINLTGCAWQLLVNGVPSPHRCGHRLPGGEVLLCNHCGGSNKRYTEL